MERHKEDIASAQPGTQEGLAARESVLYLLIYLVDCAGFQLRHLESSIFVSACGIFSCDMWGLVP